MARGGTRRRRQLRRPRAPGEGRELPPASDRTDSCGVDSIAKTNGPRDDSRGPFSENYFPAATYSPTHWARAVPSALRGLTAVFGMGTGVSPSPQPPEKQTFVKSLWCH